MNQLRKSYIFQFALQIYTEVGIKKEKEQNRWQSIEPR